MYSSVYKSHRVERQSISHLYSEILRLLLKVLTFISFYLLLNSELHAIQINLNKGTTEGVIRLIPDEIKWKSFKTPTQNNTIELKAGTLELSIKNCGVQQIPVIVVYASTPIRNSYSGYYVIDGTDNTSFRLNVFDIKQTTISAENVFSHLEIDSSFSKCIGSFKSIQYIASPFVTSIKRNSVVKVAKNNEKKIEKTILFSRIHDDRLHEKTSGNYRFKDIIKSNRLISNIKDWYAICDPSKTKSIIEKEVIQRPIVCGITNELATVDEIQIKSGESLILSGIVRAGSIYIIVRRINGGVIKILMSVRGKIKEDFRANEDGNYQILLATNMSVYNYPFLNFEIQLKHIK
jgi:hypothetical protein